MPPHDPRTPAHLPPARTRREFLFPAGGGLGCIALSWLLRRDAAWGDQDKPGGSPNPLAAKTPHFPARAKSVIFLFMVGGPSQIDLFDPKPDLEKWKGKPLPESVGKPVSQFTKGDSPLLPSTRRFKQHGA